MISLQATARVAPERPQMWQYWTDGKLTFNKCSSKLHRWLADKTCLYGQGNARSAMAMFSLHVPYHVSDLLCNIKMQMRQNGGGGPLRWTRPRIRLSIRFPPGKQVQGLIKMLLVLVKDWARWHFLSVFIVWDGHTGNNWKGKWRPTDGNHLQTDSQMPDCSFAQCALPCS